MEKRKHVEYLRGKEETKAVGDEDRKENSNVTVCFDLQNVFALPTAEVLNFFHNKKLNVYERG
jgi:hypothetical protein